MKNYGTDRSWFEKNLVKLLFFNCRLHDYCELTSGPEAHEFSLRVFLHHGQLVPRTQYMLLIQYCNIVLGYN